MGDCTKLTKEVKDQSNIPYRLKNGERQGKEIQGNTGKGKLEKEKTPLLLAMLTTHAWPKELFCDMKNQSDLEELGCSKKAFGKYSLENLKAMLFIRNQPSFTSNF